jgi:hypothetical protein
MNWRKKSKKMWQSWAGSLYNTHDYFDFEMVFIDYINENITVFSYL